MTRITVDVNDEWLDAARDVLGTDTKVATINEALHSFARRKQAVEIMSALNSVEMDFTGSAQAWSDDGSGRDLSRLEEAAREDLARRADLARKAGAREANAA